MSHADAGNRVTGSSSYGPQINPPAGSPGVGLPARLQIPVVVRRSPGWTLGRGGGSAGGDRLRGAGRCQSGRWTLLLHPADAGVCLVWLIPPVGDRSGCRDLRRHRRRGYTVGGGRCGSAWTIGRGADPDDRALVSGGQSAAFRLPGEFFVAAHPDGATQWRGDHHHGGAVGADFRLPVCSTRVDRAVAECPGGDRQDPLADGGAQPADPPVHGWHPSVATRLAGDAAGLAALHPDWLLGGSDAVGHRYPGAGRQR